MWDSNPQYLVRQHRWIAPEFQEILILSELFKIQNTKQIFQLNVFLIETVTVIFIYVMFMFILMHNLNVLCCILGNIGGIMHDTVWSLCICI